MKRKGIASIEWLVGIAIVVILLMLFLPLIGMTMKARENHIKIEKIPATNFIYKSVIDVGEMGPNLFCVEFVEHEFIITTYSHSISTIHKPDCKFCAKKPLEKIEKDYL